MALTGALVEVQRWRSREKCPLECDSYTHVVTEMCIVCVILPRNVVTLVQSSSMTKQIFAHGWGWSTGDQLPQSNRNPNSRRPLRRQRRATPSTRGLRLPMRSHSRCRCAYKRSGPVLCATCVVRKGGGEVERCHEDGANHFTLCCTPRCTSSPFVPRGATTTSDAAPPHNVLSPPAPPPSLGRLRLLFVHDSVASQP